MILLIACTHMCVFLFYLKLVAFLNLHIADNSSTDWWFVSKHLTEEKGWVPAIYLRDEHSYNLYVQKKLHEKIDKLPVFESKDL